MNDLELFENLSTGDEIHFTDGSSTAKEIVKYCERKIKEKEFENNIDDQNNSIEIVLPEEPKFETYSEWSDWFFNQNPDLYDRYYDVTKYEEKS